MLGYFSCIHPVQYNAVDSTVCMHIPTQPGKIPSFPAQTTFSASHSVANRINKVSKSISQWVQIHIFLNNSSQVHFGPHYCQGNFTHITFQTDLLLYYPLTICNPRDDLILLTAYMQKHLARQELKLNHHTYCAATKPFNSCSKWMANRWEVWLMSDCGYWTWYFCGLNLFSANFAASLVRIKAELVVLCWWNLDGWTGRQSRGKVYVFWG